MLRAFEDLPSSDFSEFRSTAAELGVPPEVLCLVIAKDHLRTKSRKLETCLEVLRQN